jgi:hypothetical protein
MARRSLSDIEKIWSNVEGIKKLSDRVIGIGPFGIGMDGLLTWVPVVGTAYSVIVAFWLMIQGFQARATPSTLLRMAGYLGFDSATSLVGEAIPFAPDLIDTVFQGHLMAGKALQKDIESTHWVEANERDAKASGDHESHIEAMRSQQKRRIVYLHD